jgi:hypothetical protein
MKLWILSSSGSIFKAVAIFPPGVRMFSGFHEYLR